MHYHLHVQPWLTGVSTPTDQFVGDMRAHRQHRWPPLARGNIVMSIRTGYPSCNWTFQHRSTSSFLARLALSGQLCSLKGDGRCTLPVHLRQLPAWTTQVLLPWTTLPPSTSPHFTGSTSTSHYLWMAWAWKWWQAFRMACCLGCSAIIPTAALLALNAQSWTTSGRSVTVFTAADQFNLHHHFRDGASVGGIREYLSCHEKTQSWFEVVIVSRFQVNLFIIELYYWLYFIFAI